MSNFYLWRMIYFQGHARSQTLLLTLCAVYYTDPFRKSLSEIIGLCLNKSNTTASSVSRTRRAHLPSKAKRRGVGGLALNAVPGNYTKSEGLFIVPGFVDLDIVRVSSWPRASSGSYHKQQQGDGRRGGLNMEIALITGAYTTDVTFSLHSA